MLSENRSRVMRLHLLLDGITRMEQFLKESPDAGVLIISCSDGEQQHDVVMDKPRTYGHGMLQSLLEQEKTLLNQELQELE